MRAALITTLEGPRSLEVGDVDEPRTADGQVLVDVHAAGVTFPDVLMSRGLYQYKPELPFVPGAELAGVVRSAPDGSGFTPGDRVAAVGMSGAFAETVAVDAGSVFALPDGVPFTLGAAVPMNYLTMHFAYAERGRLAAGETVLVHGAAGGLGTAAVQLARALGARVIGVTSTEAKAETARAAGAHDVVLADGFRDRVRELTGGRGVDVVADPVGGDRSTDSLRSLAPQGRALVLGFTAGEIPTVKVNRLLLNNIDVVGVGWGAFALNRPAYLARQWAELAPHLQSGAIDPPRGEPFDLDRAADALAELDERRAAGRVVLALR